MKSLASFEARTRRCNRPVRPKDPLPHLVMPSHHDIRAGDVFAHRLRGNSLRLRSRVLSTSRSSCWFRVLEYGPWKPWPWLPRSFTERRTALRIQRDFRWRREKDGHPFPVPLTVYDETIRVLKTGVRNAKLGREEELGALKRLDDQARNLERRASGPSVEEFISREREQSHVCGGRTVFGRAEAKTAATICGLWLSATAELETANIRERPASVIHG